MEKKDVENYIALTGKLSDGAHYIDKGLKKILGK